MEQGSSRVRSRSERRSVGRPAARGLEDLIKAANGSWMSSPSGIACVWGGLRSAVDGKAIIIMFNDDNDDFA